MTKREIFLHENEERTGRQNTTKNGTHFSDIITFTVRTLSLTDVDVDVDDDVGSSFSSKMFLCYDAMFIVGLELDSLSQWVMDS